MKGMSVFAVLAVGFFLGVGTVTNVSATGPEFLAFLDLRWWWALATSFIEWATSLPWQKWTETLGPPRTTL